MARILSIMAVFTFVTFPALAEQPIKGAVRDASGKLIVKTTTRGNQTEVRSTTGKLLMKSKTSSNSKTETRSPTGKLLYKTTELFT